MRICRFRHQNEIQFGFYREADVIPIPRAFEAYSNFSDDMLDPPVTADILAFLPPDGAALETTQQVSRWLDSQGPDLSEPLALPHDAVELLVPWPRPNKLLLLAGNYAKHIEEGGGQAAERAETFPYVFMKPPTTTLTDPNKAIRIPAVSPDHIDWELELAVIIGRTAKSVSESDGLNYVAGYTIINDISNREFRPNPTRKQRPRDAFFDWLHGKWHDSFCPCGPCVASPATVTDPQNLELKLAVNREVRQHASTTQQIFPVAAVISFISSILTLEPGDIISTGTPHGVGKSSGQFLAPGDQIEASIETIGTLATSVIAE